MVILALSVSSTEIDFVFFSSWRVGILKRSVTQSQHLCAPGTVGHGETERGMHIPLILKENTVKLGNKHATDYKPNTGVSAVAKEQMKG